MWWLYVIVGFVAFVIGFGIASYNAPSYEDYDSYHTLGNFRTMVEKENLEREIGILKTQLKIYENSRCGCVRCYNTKEYFYETRCKELQEKIDGLQEIIDKIKEDLE